MLSFNISQDTFVEPDHDVFAQGIAGPGNCLAQLFMLIGLFEEAHQTQVRRQVVFLNDKGFFKILHHLEQVLINSHSTFASELKAW